jgi:glycosyltransferase involved in cell wall biosynthesis
MSLITFGIATKITSEKRRQYLYELINSIRTQTNHQWEIIISDDASTIPVDYEQFREEKRIKIFYQKESLWIFKNFNFCLENASSEWFIPMWDDDLVKESFVNDFQALLKDSNYKDMEMLCFSYDQIWPYWELLYHKQMYVWSYKKGKESLNYVISTIFGGKAQVMCFCSIIKVKSLKQISWYPDYGMSTDLYLDFMFPCSLNMSYTEKTMVMIRLHEQNASGIKNALALRKNTISTLEVIYKKFFNCLNRSNRKLIEQYHYSLHNDHIVLMWVFQEKWRIQWIKKYIYWSVTMRHTLILLFGIVFGKNILTYFTKFTHLYDKYKPYLLH